MSGKFTVEQKAQTAIESFTITNIAELCRRHGVSIAQFYRWKKRFLKGGSNALGETSKGNEYGKEIDDLKRLVGDQALVIDAFKKSTGEEIGMITDILKKEVPVTRISRAMDIQRSTIYYTGSHGKRLPRIPQEIEEQALKIVIAGCFLCISAGTKLTPIAGLILTPVHLVVVVTVVRFGGMENDT